MEEQEPRKESPETSLRDFEQTLKRATPGVILTPVIMILNLAVFVSLLASGAGFWNADSESLVAGGANFGPLTLHSDRWRLLTYMFVHGGFVHLLINLVVFGWVGSLMERLLGRLGFFCLYLLSGIAGGLASLYWNPLAVSAGASGAIFGVYGGLLGALLRKKAAFPPGYRSGLLWSSLIFLGYNLFFGLTEPDVDWAAHLGGLVAGFPGGVFLSHDLKVEGVRSRPGRSLRVAAVGTVLLLTAFALLPKGVGRFAEAFHRFNGVKEKTQKIYNQALDDNRSGKLTNEEMAGLLQTEILPDWRRVKQDLKKINRLPGKMGPRSRLMIQYLEVQEECWSLIIRGVQEPNPALFLRANALQDEANRLEEIISRQD